MNNQKPPMQDPPNIYTPGDIKAWLEAKPANAIVGYCSKLGECLVAEFLLEKGYCIPEVEPYAHNPERGAYLAWFYYDMQYCEIPSELAALARNFDDLGVWGEGITAKEALTLFE